MARIAYRVARSALPLWDGEGAYRRGGRWNSPGVRVIYAGISFAGCLLEILVHAGRVRLPGRHVAARIVIPDEVRIEELRDGDLRGWNAPEATLSRRFGDRWLAERRSAVLLVPSAVGRPFERNAVLNPAHPDFASINLGEPVDVAWDPRLFG